MKRINLDGFVEQDFGYQCPECNYDLLGKPEYIIGYGYYPKGGFRNKMKPNAHFAIGFECPKCFVKSVCHEREENYADRIRSN